LSQAVEIPARSALAERTILGQPRGLATLFFTEMWERFTYYGLRAILILFMVAAVGKGGLGLDDRTASTIYGLYVAGTYLLSPLGGWIADRLVGAQRAVMSGGILIMIGSAMLISGTPQIFFLGLLVIVCGVGLLKPNVSAIVGMLYPEGGSRRDAGFSIFYMGINTGSFLGSLLVPLVADRFGWHWGFALPAVGMVLGLIQLALTSHYLGTAGLAVPAERRGSWLPVIGLVAVIGVVVTLVLGGEIRIDPLKLARGASWVMGFFAAAYFLYLFFFAGLTGAERGRCAVMAALFTASVVFWAGYEQMGASFNLFAQRYTERHILGWEMPAGVLQAVNPILIIVFAPVLAALWLYLGKRERDPSAPAKLGAGLIFMGLGFLVMYVASGYVLSGEKVLPTWLVATYTLHTWGELCLSPVGLSSMSKLAPQRLVGQVMGLWMLSMAVGDNLAGLLSSEYDASHLESLPGLFTKIFWWGVVAGGLMLLVTPVLKRLMAGVK
jgi:POT family proton-dependent oligopeptide transporter